MDSPAPQAKNARKRVAFVLLCGLALACTIMSITSDASDEFVLEESESPGQKVLSVDVDKVGRIYTTVPDDYEGDEEGGTSGRARLLNYFKEIERRIASETAARKNDITLIRSKMAKNRAYNAEARSKMKKMLLAKMAENAKQAKDALDHEMANTARTFAKQAALANKRWRKNNKRFKKTRAIMAKNKREAAKALAAATANQQKALATLDQQMNSRISQTNKHIAANAAQIKINAKKARDELDAANSNFDSKMNAVKTEAADARSKLQEEAKQMDKKVRALIAGKVKAISTKTAAQFSKVRTKMADDRHHADMMLKQTTTKMNAALHQAQTLQDQRFATTVTDIAKAKEEADGLVTKMKSDFKVSVMHLKSKVTEQVTKLNGRVTQLQGIITNNKLEQANVNRHVTAELKRMVNLGSSREAALAEKDTALRTLMQKNHDENAKAMLSMANKFNNDMSEIKKQMKKDRAHAEHNLKKQTSGLYATLAANAKAQEGVNQELVASQKAAQLDAQDALRAAKKDFTGRLAELHATVVKNDEKADAKIKKLTGIVDEQRIQDAEGRKSLRMMAEANKAELKTAIRNAVHTGEMRALKAEKMASDMNSKTRNAINMKITNEISSLTKTIHTSVENLQLSSKKAREAMKKEVLFAVREAADEAKKNLADTIKWSNAKFNALDKTLEGNAAEGKAARDAMKASVDADKKEAHKAITDAVANQNRALLALQTSTQKKIDKANTDVAAYGAAMKQNAKDVAVQMASNAVALNGKLEAAKAQAKQQLSDANAASVKRHTDAINFIEDAIAKADADAQEKFGKLYVDMADQRMDIDKKISASATDMQAKIAKRSALYDARFSKTVKDLDAAKKAAADEVEAARKEFTTGIVAITATIKDQETRLEGEIEIVGTEVRSTKAAQMKINKHVDGELKRILELSDTSNSEARKARGAIRKVIDEHKAIAKQERDALAETTKTSLRKLRAHQAHLREEAATELSDATGKLYDSLSQHADSQKTKHNEMSGHLNQAVLNTEEKMRRAKEEFEAKITGLTNQVTSDNTKFEAGLGKLTGVVHDWKKQADEGRELLKTQVKAMEKDLSKSIVKAIQIGEAKMKRVQERALSNQDAAKKALSGEIAERVEKTADEVYKALQQDRGKIANNYLALKAYCGAMSDELIDYTTKAKGTGLFSLGDLLTLVASLSSTRTKAAEGPAAGGSEIPPIFNGKPVKVSSSFTKANGLVNEWAKALAMVRSRWLYGIGHYLLTKVQFAMQKEGILTTGKVDDASGEHVFVNAHAIGLSNRLSTFDKLAAPSRKYQAALKKLTEKLPEAVSVPQKHAYYVSSETFKGPWNGQ